MSISAVFASRIARILKFPEQASFGQPECTLYHYRSVRLSKSDWVTFDVTSAVQQWLTSSQTPSTLTNTIAGSERGSSNQIAGSENGSSNQITSSQRGSYITKQCLDIWVESSEMGQRAAKATKYVKFVPPRTEKHKDRLPQLEIIYNA